MSIDSYKKLRPWTEIEFCECETVHGLFLVDLHTDNPIHCDFCRKEVDPERLELTAEETDQVASWFMQENALYQLWLASGEYEAYAKAQLLDPVGQVNRDGLATAKFLSKRISTRPWLFSDTDDGEPTRCPICNLQLDKNVKWGTGKCTNCPIQM